MNWKYILNRKIKAIYYFNEIGMKGQFFQNYNFHFIQEGNIVFKMENNELITLEVNDTVGINFSKNSEENFIDENLIDLKKDKIWSNVSNLIIKQIHFLKINSNNSENEVLTISIEFYYGEKIYFSNAGFIDEQTIGESFYDMVIYNKRKIGEKYNLI